MKIAKWALVGFFGAIITAIVFVKAGKSGGQSGGDQSAAIIKASSGGVAQIASALEGA